MTTGAFSRNIDKLFSELKLVTDNLPFIQAVLVVNCLHHNISVVLVNYN